MVECPKCSAPLPEEWFTGRATGTCVNCNSHYEVRGFPAIAGVAQSLTASQLALAEGEASCFQHASKKAVAACNQCGRFLCALCEMDANGAVWCPTCLVSGISKHNVAVLENHRTLYDSIALGMAALPLLIFYIAFLTGPVAVFLAIRYWRRPSSLVPRNKWRLVVALVLGILETIGLFAFIILIVWAVSHRDS